VEFEIRERVRDQIPVVSVVGELDIATAPTLREHLTVHETASVSTIVVDLLRVTFLDSSALAVLVGFSRRLEKVGGALRLVIAEKKILKTLDVTGLIGVLTVNSTVRSALAAARR
jgi:anti-sigma B factor antagonist